MKVVTEYRYSGRHGRWYSGGTFQYDGLKRSRTLSRSFHCVCGDPVWDGDPICVPAYEGGLIVHVGCCPDHDHGVAPKT